MYQAGLCYSYTKPYLGTQNDVDISDAEDEATRNGGNVVADVHTHSDPALPGFSDADLADVPKDGFAVVVEDGGSCIRAYTEQSGGEASIGTCG